MDAAESPSRTDPDPVRLLLRYTAWANRLLYEALAGVPAEVLEVPRAGRPAGLAGVLGHMVLIAEVWKAHLSGTQHGFQSRQLDPIPPLAELGRRQTGLDAWYLDHATGHAAGGLTEPVSFTFIGGGAGCMRRGDILLHVANHATYHRGYVADMLYESGLRPPTMDLPVYLRDAAGAARP